MKEEYRDWIRHNVPACPRGLCDVMTQNMADEFPELRRVKGHVDDIGGEHPHFWCVTGTGEIVDPTASQFAAPHNYREHVGPEPIGKCINCGEYIYPGVGYSVACSEACGRALEAEFNSLVGGR